MFRDNLFDSTDKALEVWGPNAADCRWNWWDDESGPFHEQLNPEGQGDIVTGENVLLWPWHTDTLFYLDAPERPPQMPTSFELEVYPNPFNAVATLKLYVDQPGIYRVDAYNVLGQQVEEIWSGPLAIDKQVVWNASALGSDIYFVRVWQVIGNRPKAMEKVVLIK